MNAFAFSRLDKTSITPLSLRFIRVLLGGIGMALALLPQTGGSVAVKGLYVGNEFYAPGLATQTAARASGFTRLFLCSFEVGTNGDIAYNHAPVVQNGVYIGDPTFGAKLAALKVPPTSVDRIELVVGGPGSSAFDHLKPLMDGQGIGTNSLLYQNFRALKAATGVDVVQLYDSQTYDLATTVACGKMLASLGLKVSLCVRANPTYWGRVKAQLGESVDAVYLQCYQDGAGNHPGSWQRALGETNLYPGLWGNTDTPSTATGKMRKWQTTLGITGGFMWLNGFLPEDAPKWAQALAYGLDPLPSFRIVNKNSGKAMGWTSRAPGNGAKIEQWGFNPNDSQQWSLVPAEDGEHYQLMSWTSGKCASIANNSILVGGRLWLWDYCSEPSQQFDLVPAASGWLKLRNVRSGLVLEVAAGSSADQTTIQQNVDTGAANQLWKLYPDNDGLLAGENFDYPAGALSGQRGGEGWNGVWLDELSPTRVRPGSLRGGTNVPQNYAALASGNAAFVDSEQRVGRYLDCAVNGPFGVHGYLGANGHIGADGKTLYLSFLQQPGKTSLFYEFELNRGPERIAGIGNDTRTENVCLRAPANAFTAIGPGDTNVNFYVVRIDFKPGHDDVRVYRNPTAMTEPATPTLTLTNVADLSFDRISLGAFANGNSVAHDQIRLATAWQYAIGEAPEPVNQASSNLVCDGIFRPVRISAQVLGGNGQMYYLMDGNISLRLLLSQPLTFEPGDILDVTGLAQRQQEAMVLMDAVPRKIGHSPLPRPRPLLVAAANRQSDWVSVEGMLMGTEANGTELKLQAGLKTFVARLRSNSPPVTDWQIGSRLKLTGVYVPMPLAVAQASQPTVYGSIPAPSATLNQLTQGTEPAFELMLNSPADIEVLARPPWWTLKRVLVVVGVLAAGLALAFMWIGSLRQQVAHQTVRLKREITEREQADRARAIEEERSRISRDLHDNLGSMLTQINMLAAAPADPATLSETARERMLLIADKSGHMISALDAVVWMMNPQAESLSALVAYMAAYTEEFLARTGIVCRIETPKSYPEITIPAEARNSLFACVKEAVNNAVRHGQPRQIALKFSVTANQLEIQIHDNGLGFDPLAVERGHGLANLQQRMQTLNGTCLIQSAPPGGTTVKLGLPLKLESEPAQSAGRLHLS